MAEAFTAPLVGAIAGPVLGAVIGGIMQPDAPSMPNLPPPPLPAALPAQPALPALENNKDQSTLDLEAAKLRDIKRRTAKQQQGVTLLNQAGDDSTTTKTLLGS